MTLSLAGGVQHCPLTQRGSRSAHTSTVLVPSSGSLSAIHRDFSLEW